ncbi:TonB C-terminal domain-containing protein [Desulfovibrio sp. SGI.169]|uniref:cell envelope integrity protein TolA n=1 Tax=Desulfovibrio sp. SGI.169 TaxID=3420561 RepID=UPI003CFFD36B
MRLASYVLSFCLHLAVFLLIWFWPSHPPLRLDTPPVMISLVEGAPGGNRTPSPILGHMGEPAEGPRVPTPPAPKNEIAAPAREEVREPAPVPAPPKEAAPVKKPELKPEPKPEPKPAPKPEAAPVAEKKKDPPKKEEAPKSDAKKQEKKEQPPRRAPREDPVAAALQKARKASSRAESGDRGNAIEQALAQAQRRAGGNRGGGGGEGDGPGGGGLGDVYMGQVMLAVRPNWGFASAARANLACSVRVRVDMQGKVLLAELSQSSGNAQYDASAVNAVVRTGQAGQFPPPPSAQYTDLELVFSYDEIMGR